MLYSNVLPIRIRHTVRLVVDFIHLTLTAKSRKASRAGVYKYIKNNFHSTNQINVYFIVTQIDLWMNDPLYKTIMNSSKYKCIILVFPNFEGSREDFKTSASYNLNECKKNDLNYINCWDNEKDKIGIRPSDLTSGIIFFEQPQQRIWEGWEIDRVHENHLVYYFPYGMLLANLPYMHYQLKFYFYCDAIFVESKFRKFLFLIRSPGVFQSVAITGFPKSDLIHLSDSNHFNKDTNSVVWAPHWSVDFHKKIHFSTFYQMAQVMLEIAQEFPTINFTMRPHPRLFLELKNSASPQSLHLEDFTNKWNKLENTEISTGGNYTDIFRRSSILVTDSVSFLYEYFGTSKPIINLTPLSAQNYNYLGKKLVKSCYQAGSKEEIVKLLKNIVVLGADPLLIKRIKTLKSLKKRIPRDSPHRIMAQLDNISASKFGAVP